MTTSAFKMGFACAAVAIVSITGTLMWAGLPAQAAEGAAVKKLAPDVLWLMEVKDGPATPAQTKANLAYQADIEAKGIKIIGGSVIDPATDKRINGLVFIHAKNEAEAKAVVAGDPGVKDGSRIVTLRKFSLNSGTMTFQIHFGDANATEFR